MTTVSVDGCPTVVSGFQPQDPDQVVRGLLLLYEYVCPSIITQGGAMGCTALLYEKVRTTITSLTKFKCD